MKDFRVRLPEGVVKFLEGRPWINVSQLVRVLVRDGLALPVMKPKDKSVTSIRFTDDEWAAVLRTGKSPATVIRALLTNYADEERFH